MSPGSALTASQTANRRRVNSLDGPLHVGHGSVPPERLPLPPPLPAVPSPSADSVGCRQRFQDS
eukprot:10551487-Alexandrium_andersonii.AAC.1